MAGNKVRVTVELNASQIKKGLGQAEKDMDKFKSTTVRTDKAMKGLAGSVAAAFSVAALRSIATMGLEMVKLSERATATRKSFGRLGGTQAQLQRLRDVTQGTVSDMVLMQKAGQSAIAGLDFNDIATTMDFLRRRSIAFGEDFNNRMQTVMTGLQRGSVLFLDDVGIIIDGQDKMFNGLDASAKKAMIVKEAVRQMRVQMDLLGKPVQQVSDDMSRLAVKWEKFKEDAGSSSSFQRFWQNQAAIFSSILDDVSALGTALDSVIEGTREFFGAAPPALNFTPQGPSSNLAPGRSFTPGKSIDIQSQGQAGIRPSAPVGEGVSDGARFLKDIEVQAAAAAAEVARLTFLEEQRMSSATMSAEQIFDAEQRLTIGRFLELKPTRAQTLELMKLQKVEKQHFVETQKKVAQEKFETSIEKFRSEQLAIANRKKAEEVDMYRQLNQVMSRLAPNMQNFGNAAIALAQGDTFGAVIGGVHGLLDVFGVARDRTDAWSQDILKATRKIADAQKTLVGSATGIGGGLGDEILAAQFDAIQPLLRLWDQVNAHSTGSSVQKLETFIRTVSAIGKGGQDLEGNWIKAAFGDRSNNAAYGAAIRAAFGQEENFASVATRIFAVRDAFDDLGDSLDNAGAAAKRAIQLETAIEEQALRLSAREQLVGAGADPYEQRKVIQGLKAAVQALHAGAGSRAGSRAGRASKSVGSPGTGTGHVDFPTSTVDAGALVPAPVAWTDALVFPSEPGSFADWGVTRWAQIFAVGELTRQNVPWWTTIHMTKSSTPDWIPRRRWADIFALRLSELRKQPVPWWRAIQFTKSSTGDWVPSWRWDQIFALRDDELTKHKRSWHQALEFNAAEYVDERWGVNRWSQVFLIDNSTDGERMSKHTRAWQQAIRFSAAEYVDERWGVNRWSQVFLIDNSTDGSRMDRHTRQWHQAIQFGGPSSMSNFGVHSWWDVIRVDIMDRVILQPSRVFKLGGEKIRVEAVDIFDIQGLDDMVVSAVNRAVRDRTEEPAVPVDPNAGREQGDGLGPVVSGDRGTVYDNNGRMSIFPPGMGPGS